MSRALVALALAAGASAAQGEREPLPAAALALLEPHGIERFPPLYRRALGDFLRAERDLRAGRVDECADRLERLWRDHPPGTGRWQTCDGTVAGLNVGHPPCYYALRMLTDVAQWARTSRMLGAPRHTATVRMTVVLVGASRGVQPRDAAELEDGSREEVRHELDPRLLEHDHRVVHESLGLFRAYVEAITQGRLTVDVGVLHLAELEVGVACVAAPRRHASLAPGALDHVWRAVPDDVRGTTDWWWVVYPSHVPEQHADFARTEFVTGGMAAGADRSSPCFLIDDRWLVRCPPHLGRGEYDDVQRRCYLPQWLQHEFCHHLFRTWPELELEKTDHQWFDRATWPADFEGVIEPDYYHEALHRRLIPRADPPLHVGLRYQPPPASSFRRLRLRDLLGVYAREPVENAWHEGEITRRGDGLLWTNGARVSWRLDPDLRAGLLRTGPDCPYHEGGGRAFHVLFERDPDTGEWTRRLRGFTFHGAVYVRRR